MAETTGIAWTDSTFNPWIGCLKVSPGCDHCYAEALDKRHRWGGATHWGAGVPRHRTSADYWRKPLAWNKAREKDGKRHLVFCASLADVFDNEVPEEWRADLFDLIATTPFLTWLLLTKRIGNAAKMLDEHVSRIGAWMDRGNVWLGASVVDQAEAYRDVPKLLATPAAVRFVSYEPALGPVNWKPWLTPIGVVSPDPHGRDKAIDWLIVGGESTQGARAREFDTAWARSAVALCREAGVAPFVKQLGSNLVSDMCGPIWSPRYEDTGKGNFRIFLKDRAGADPAEWPEDLRVQEFPQSSRADTPRQD